MYAWRLGEVFPTADIAVLRGMEGARMKATYKRLAEQYGVAWDGRCYDRQHPEDNDEVNQAINHAASAVEAGAMIAVAATGAIPQLGFVHEDSGNAFTLDIADLFRDSVTLPAAFGAVSNRDPSEPLERTIRRVVGKKLRDEGMVGRMIERIKELLRVDDGRSNP
jgi:CRISPR-associated protein Cas1